MDYKVRYFDYPLQFKAYELVWQVISLASGNNRKFGRVYTTRPNIYGPAK